MSPPDGVQGGNGSPMAQKPPRSPQEQEQDQHQRHVRPARRHVKRVATKSVGGKPPVRGSIERGIQDGGGFNSRPSDDISGGSISSFPTRQLERGHPPSRPRTKPRSHNGAGETDSNGGESGINMIKSSSEQPREQSVAGVISSLLSNSGDCIGADGEDNVGIAVTQLTEDEEMASQLPPELLPDASPVTAAASPAEVHNGGVPVDATILGATPPAMTVRQLATNPAAARTSTTTTPVTTPASLTTVNGMGLWESWKRNFKTPFLAMLDLLDNAVDAALRPANADHGKSDGRCTNKAVISSKVYVERDEIRQRINDDGGNGSGTGLVLTNTSQRKIRPMSRILEVYNSKKGGVQRQDHIGENGVGLKQGCATLSDLSFIISRSGKSQFSLGVIAVSLQQLEGVRLPSFVLDLPPRNDNGDGDTGQGLEFPQLWIDTIRMKLQSIAMNDPSIGECFRSYGNGDMEVGILLLVDHFVEIGDNPDDWGYHCFRVILTELRHGSAAGPSSPAAAVTGTIGLNMENAVDGVLVSGDATTTTSGDKRKNNDNRNRCSSNEDALLKELVETLTMYYLHIPDTVDFTVNGKRLRFVYWQKRLVELTKFEFRVDPTRPIRSLPKGDRSFLTMGRTVRVFAGFDAARVGKKGSSNVGTGDTCSLYVYSREAGRLICSEHDARHTIGLTTSGTVFCQGLTIIVDDVHGTLPLNPTKQDLAFGEEQHGEAHRENLWSWVGATTNFYWLYHAAKFCKKKRNTYLKDAVQCHYPAVDDMIASANEENGYIPSLTSGDWTCFEKIAWTIRLMNEKLFIRQGAFSSKNVLCKEGSDTDLRIVPRPDHAAGCEGGENAARRQQKKHRPGEGDGGMLAAANEVKSAGAGWQSQPKRKRADWETPLFNDDVEPATGKRGVAIPTLPTSGGGSQRQEVVMIDLTDDSPYNDRGSGQFGSVGMNVPHATLSQSMNESMSVPLQSLPSAGRTTTDFSNADEYGRGGASAAAIASLQSDLKKARAQIRKKDRALDLRDQTIDLRGKTIAALQEQVVQKFRTIGRLNDRMEELAERLAVYERSDKNQSSFGGKQI